MKKPKCCKRKKRKHINVKQLSPCRVAVPIPLWLNRHIISNITAECRNSISPHRVEKAQEILASLPVIKKINHSLASKHESVTHGTDTIVNSADRGNSTNKSRGIITSLISFAKMILNHFKSFNFFSVFKRSSKNV